jgi:hypothetical protein
VKLQAFQARFVNRTDTYCVQSSDGRYTRVFRSLGVDQIQAHLEGRITLAVDALDRRSLARWLCLDSDAPEGLAQLATLQTHLADRGIVSLREMSRRGGHLWVLCEAPQPAILLRQLAQSVLGQQRMEVYPASDVLAGKVSHPVRLPFGRHQLTGQVYPFLTSENTPAHEPTLAAAVDWLLAQPANTGAWLNAAAQMRETDPTASPARMNGASHGVIGWVNHELRLPDVIAATHPGVQLRKAGKGFSGWCPWHDDTAPQADGRPGTPSLYVVHDARYGWSWRCLSTNCGVQLGPLHHTFDWFLWAAAGHIDQAMDLAKRWKEHTT